MKNALLFDDLHPEQASRQERLDNSLRVVRAAIANLNHGHTLSIDFFRALAFVWVSALVQLSLNLQQLLLEFLDLLRRELRIVNISFHPTV